MDVSEEDLPIITEKVDEIVAVYAEHNENSRRSKLRGVASGITGSVEITDDEQKELEKHIDAIKSSGKLDQAALANLDAAYAKAKADGKITVAEKANLEAVIRAIHNATNI
jgi:tellurite resistance protein